MSRRQIRKLEEARLAKKLKNEQESRQKDDSSDEESDDEQPITQSIRNRFDLLLDDGSDNNSESPNSDEDETNPSNSSQQICPASPERCGTGAVHRSNKKRQKKKKKKNKINNNDDDMNQLEDIDELLSSITPPPSSAAVEASSITSPLGPVSLLSADYRYFDADAELRRMYGTAAAAVRPAVNRRRGQRPGERRKASVTGKPMFPYAKESGISMEKDEDYLSANDNGCSGDAFSVFRFDHDKAYRTRQQAFETALAAQDGHALSMLLQAGHVHCDTMMQVTGMLLQQEDYEQANELVLHTIQVMERSCHYQFRLLDGSGSRLDYSWRQNRALFVGLYHHMNAAARRRCYRTALELNKVLLRLGVPGKGEEDPLAAKLLTDQFAMRSHEFTWFLEYYDTYNASLCLEDLPNYAYSVPLALYYLSEGNDGNTDCHKQLKKRLLDAASCAKSSKLRSRADALLLRAVCNFPGLLLQLATENSVTFDAELQQHLLQMSDSSNTSATTTVPSSLTLFYQMYVLRMSPYWKEPDVTAWVKNTVTLSSLKATAAAENRTKAAVWPSCSSLPKPIRRHVLLSGLPELLHFLSRDGGESLQFQHHDPFPPHHSRTAYATHVAASTSTHPQHFFPNAVLDDFAMELANMIAGIGQAAAGLGQAAVAAVAALPANTEVPGEQAAVTGRADGMEVVAEGNRRDGAAAATDAGVAATTADVAAAEAIVDEVSSAVQNWLQTIRRTLLGEEEDQEALGGEAPPAPIAPWLEDAGGEDESYEEGEEDDFNEDQDQI